MSFMIEKKVFDQILLHKKLTVFLKIYHIPL